MNPGIFETLKNTPAVTALIGVKPVRFYPYGIAVDKVVRPYATYGVVNGTPENTLDGSPLIDNQSTQVDIWAVSVAECEAVFVAIRDALEPLGHMTNFTSAARDPETQLFRSTLEFDFWVDR